MVTFNFNFVLAYICETKLIYNCPNGFSKFGNNCFYLSIKTATWQEAFFQCKYLMKGSKLVAPRKYVEDNTIRQFLKHRKNGNIKLFTINYVIY